MLTKINDLHRITPAQRKRCLKLLDQLRFRYMRMIEQRDEPISYQVDIKADSDRAPGIHASEVSKCMRALSYAIRGTEKRKNPSNTNIRMRFGIGHAVHAMLQNDLHLLAKREADLSFKDEVPISPAIGGAAEIWNIQSSCDGILQFHEGDSETTEPFLRVGLEIKTESDKRFAKLVEPREDHYKQACVYMHCLDLPLMWMLYYNKSNSSYTPAKPPWLFQYNPQTWSKLERRMAEATASAYGGVLPDREESFECSWCPYAWTCGPGYLANKGRRA